MTGQLGHVVIQQPDVISMNAALDAAFAKLGVEKLGGASGYGWSRYYTLQQCPYRFYLRHHRKLRLSDTDPAPLEIGGAYHAFLALYYQRQIDILSGIAPEKATPESGELCDLLLEANADAYNVNEAWRVFENYANYYEQKADYLIPMAVEKFTQDPRSVNTCRYDLVARVEDPDCGIVPGVYIVEHKTAGALRRDTVEGWHLDGEILGQYMLWKLAGLSKKYSKVQGIIVNIITKEKKPHYHREIVTPPSAQARWQWKDLKVWRAMEQLYESMGYWPRALANCCGRYGFCDYWDYCRNKH